MVVTSLHEDDWAIVAFVDWIVDQALAMPHTASGGQCEVDCVVVVIGKHPLVASSLPCTP